MLTAMLAPTPGAIVSPAPIAALVQSDNLRSLLGILAIVGLGVLLSADRKAIRWRTVVAGIALQLVFGVFVLKTALGVRIFHTLGDGVNRLMDFSKEGARFVFGGLGTFDGGFGFVFAFQILPTVIFMGALMSVLYHLGLMQRVVQGMAFVMRRVMRVSGAESLAAAANVFVGQTEAPLVIRPYLASMTRSELMALMTGGFATVAGGVLVLYAGMGIDPAHLLAASVMSAPASLVMAKLILPETEVPKTVDAAEVSLDSPAANVLDAAATGTADGLKLALNVAAMLIGFVALMKLCDAMLVWIGAETGLVALIRQVDPGFGELTLSAIFGTLFRPVALAIGVSWADSARYGDLIGTQVILTELVAYQKLAGWLQGGFEPGGFSPRAAMIATYGLCGFANVGSIGIQLGGIGALVESRRQDLARLALRAMLAGLLACNMTAAVAGALVTDAEAEYRHARALVDARARAGKLTGEEAGFYRRVAERNPGTPWAAKALEAAKELEKDAAKAPVAQPAPTPAPAPPATDGERDAPAGQPK